MNYRWIEFSKLPNFAQNMRWVIILFKEGQNITEKLIDAALYGKTVEK